jgi:hypothetical protein
VPSLADTTFVSIFRDRHRKGFPQPQPATEPDAGFRASDYAPGPLDGKPSEHGRHIVRSVRELVTTPFDTDAHFAVYVNYEVPFRLNHGVWAHSTETFLHVDAYDIDCPKPLRDAEGRASEAWWQEEQVKIYKLLAAETGVVCFRSRGGYRLLGARRHAFKIDSEAATVSWTRDYVLRGAYLHRTYGILIDPACRDWTRLQRTALATREGRGMEPGIVLGDLEAFGPWRYPGLLLPIAEAALAELAETRPEWASAKGAANREKTAQPASKPVGPGATWDLESERVKAVIQHIADNFPATGRHALCLAIGGMLRDRGTTPEVAQFIVYEACRLGGSTDPQTRAKAAADTWRLPADAAKTAFTTVCKLMGLEPAKRLGELLTEVEHEALLRRRRAPKPASAKPSPKVVQQTSVSLSDMRDALQRVKRKKASSEDPKNLTAALLLQRIADGEVLSAPADEDEVTGLSCEQALDRAVTVLAWNCEPQMPWVGVWAVIEASVIEMASGERPVSAWMRQAEETYRQAVMACEVSKQKRREAVRKTVSSAIARMRGDVQP